jgi:hypothetical protein
MVCPLTVLFSFPFCPVLSCPVLSFHLSCPVLSPVLSFHVLSPVLSCPVTFPVLSCCLSCPVTFSCLVHVLSPIVHVTCSYISCTAPMKYSIKFKLFSSRTTLVLLLGPILVPSRFSPFHCIFFLELKS